MFDILIQSKLFFDLVNRVVSPQTLFVFGRHFKAHGSHIEASIKILLLQIFLSFDEVHSHVLDKQVELSEVSLLLHVENPLFRGRMFVWYMSVVKDITFVDFFVKVIQNTVQKDLDILYVNCRELKEFRPWSQISISSILTPVKEHQENFLQICFLFNTS